VDKPIKASEYGAVAVSLVVRDTKAAIDFYKKVLGAEHLYSLTMPNGGTAHAEFKIGDTIIMIADENPEWGNKSPQTLGGSPVTLNIMVDNPDATLAEAEKAGGRIIFPVADQFYGFRSGRFQDPSGHVWIVSKVLEELSPKEMQKRMDAMLAGMQEKGSAEASKLGSSGKRPSQSKAAQSKTK
jgi:PhnB protein